MALKWTKRGARARLGDVLGGRVIRIVRKARPSEPMSRIPDPMPVVRAAMAWRDWDATPDTTTDADLSAAVDAYRTLAALDDEYQAAVAATKGEGE